MRALLGIIGKRLSGKDTVGEYLQTKFDAFHIKYSMILDELLDILDQPKSRRNEIDIGMAMRSVFHEGVLNKAVKKKLLQSPAELNIVNGIRFEDEFDMMQSLGAKFLYIAAPQDVLYQRFLSRNQKADDSMLTAGEFAALENEPTEIKIPQLGDRCDFRIDNSGTREELFSKVDEVMRKVLPPEAGETPKTHLLQ